MELEEFAFQGCPDVRGPQTKKSLEKSLNNVEQENVSYLYMCAPPLYYILCGLFYFSEILKKNM